MNAILAVILLCVVVFATVIYLVREHRAWCELERNIADYKRKFGHLPWEWWAVRPYPVDCHKQEEEGN